MKTGKIKHWNDDKGYGFITPNDGSADRFFHISQWQHSNRPSAGDIVNYEEAQDHQQKPIAINVASIAPIPEQRSQPHRPERRQNSSPKKDPLKSPSGILSLLIVTFLGAWMLWKEPTTPPSTETTKQAHLNCYTTVPYIDKQVDQTVTLIMQGGPFPYPDKDGSVFGNHENRLPQKQRGYYREYTVPTLGASNRGAQRMVTGGTSPIEFYYTADHYNTFQPIEVKKCFNTQNDT